MASSSSTSETQGVGPFTGARVVEVSRFEAAAFCTQLLADSGATVVKVGPPDRAPSVALDHGKQCLDVDLKSAEGRRSLDGLLDAADVVVDDFEPALRDQLQLSYEALRRRRPSLITASITLWGVDADDPLASRGRASIVAEAEGTQLHWRKDKDGRPLRLGFPYGELLTGLAAYSAITTAVIEREETGLGRHLNLSMVRSLLSLNSTNVALAQIPPEPGTGTAGFSHFKARDGWIALGVNMDQLWARLAHSMDRADLAEDPRYKHYSERDRRVSEVNAMIAEWMATRGVDEIVEKVSTAGVPVGRIARPEDVLQDAAFERLGILREVDGGSGRTVRVPSSPFGFSLSGGGHPEPSTAPIPPARSTAASGGPLSGVVVVDLTQILAGPFCTMLLADAGATVLKISPPGGEYSQTRGALRHGPAGAILSYFSAAMNRGKRSLELDLKNPQGKLLFERLVDGADVLIDNFAPATMPRLGILYDELRRRRPELITASITLWGVPPEDPLARRGGVAIVAEGESTLSHTAAAGDGTPQAFGFPIGDLTSGLSAYANLVTALLQRKRTRLGRHLAVSMVHSLITMNSINIAAAQLAVQPQDGAAYGIFNSSDGFVALGVTDAEEWARLCELMERPDLAEARFTGSEVTETVNGWTGSRTSSELVDLLGPSGVPVGGIATPADALKRGDLHRLEFLWTLNDGLGGTIEVPANPFGYGFGEKRISRIGADTQQTLHERLGIDRTEYERLQEKGAFGSSQLQLTDR